jgi:uncharacterized membrane protein YhaH (DUF805 family)
MGNAISVCFKKYATFSGRASRSEFWFFYLFYMIFYFVGMAAGIALDSSVIVYLFVIPLFLPLLAAAVRRIHDTGRSGWFYLVPIYNIVLLVSASNPGTNKYGDL